MKNNELKKLTDAELEIMLIIWRAEKPVNADYILNIIKDTRDWKRTTLHTMLNRLISKGFLSCKKNYKNYLFSPIICEEDYKKAESKSILNKLFKNSIPSFLAYFYSGREISEAEVKELYEVIERIKGDGDEL